MIFFLQFSNTHTSKTFLYRFQKHTRYKQVLLFERELRNFGDDDSDWIGYDFDNICRHFFDVTTSTIIVYISIKL